MERAIRAKIEKPDITVGFIPILCAAPLILAHANGIFEKNGLHITLKRAPGWSGIKELIAYEKIDAAHMLSPMPLASNLGIDGKKSAIRLMVIQNVNGQALTLSMKHKGISSVQDMRGFTFGVPYGFSMHCYLLSHYLAHHGLNPLKEVSIIEVAPPNMPNYLKKGWVDGIFAPEPFNQISVNLGIGFIHLLSKDIWDGHPCCCLATTQKFQRECPNTYYALMKSVLEAEWMLHCSDSEERRRMAGIISDPEHLNLDDPLPAEQVLTGLFPDGHLKKHSIHPKVPDRIAFIPYPLMDYGLWVLSQMQRWGQLTRKVDYRKIVEDTFDSTLSHELSEIAGYTFKEHSGFGNVGFNGKDPFAYMLNQPHSHFVEKPQNKRSRDIPKPILDRLCEINGKLAEAAGGMLNVTFTAKGDDELGRLEELLTEFVLNRKFASQHLTHRNTMLREREQELVIYRKELEIRSKIAEVFLTASNEHMFDEILNLVLEIMESKYGVFGYIDEKGDLMVPTMTRHIWDQCNVADKTIIFPKANWGESTWVIALREKTINFTNKTSTTTPKGHIAVTRHVSLPIVYRGKSIGLIQVANKKTDYTPQDIGLIEMIGNTIAPILNARLERDLEEKERRQAEAELLKHKEQLEELIKERTKELHAANTYLQKEVAERKRGEIELLEKTELLQKENWIRSGVARFRGAVSGDLTIEGLASKAISEIIPYIGAQVGAIYVQKMPGETMLSLASSYGISESMGLPPSFQPGEGLPGQVFLEKKEMLINQVPKGYLDIVSGLGRLTAQQIFIIPFLFEDRAKGVLEIATLGKISEQCIAYLSQTMSTLAIAVESAQARQMQNKLLKESQQLSEELKAQQEELRLSNSELEGQTRKLKESEEELQVTNEELEEKNELLARQKAKVEKAKVEIQLKAEEVATASKYKSEFLTNMSHELRTPLNSLLILAQGLSQNKTGNLTSEQVESAQIIHDSGNDLLHLINEILDLSKIEAGRMSLHLETVWVKELGESVQKAFQHMAKEKTLHLDVILDEDIPEKIVSDRYRIEQILRNFLSNAIKFTEKGGVKVTFFRPAKEVDLSFSGLLPPECLGISVKDTGIGIAPKRQRLIFKAFHQVSGGDSRQYGGTGLGLSISKELSTLLGGEIEVQSEAGKGATFTLYLPLTLAVGEPSSKERNASKKACISKKSPPKSVSKKRIEQEERHEQKVLVVEDDAVLRKEMVKLIGSHDVLIHEAETGNAAMKAIGLNTYDCVVLDLKLPDINGDELLVTLEKEGVALPPVIVHTARELSPEEELDIREYADSIIIKDGRSKERLLDEVSLFLHEVVDSIKERPSRIIRNLNESDEVLKDKKVLIVDDDMRTTFALSKFLLGQGMKPFKAENGERALKLLEEEKDISLVLMDVMMPVMDGFEAIKRIRAQVKFKDLPIITLTAKAMSEDREKCILAGASDYLTKPVDTERLISMIRVWLYR